MTEAGAEKLLQAFETMVNHARTGMIKALTILIHDRSLPIECRKRISLYKNLLEEQDINQFRVIDVRGTLDGKIGHMVNIPQTQIEKITDKTTFNIVNTGKEEVSVWIESEGCDICEAIVSRNSFLAYAANTLKEKGSLCLSRARLLYTSV